MTMDLLQGINAILLVITGFFLRETWTEIRTLRNESKEHANRITEHGVRLEGLRQEVNELHRRRRDDS